MKTQNEKNKIMKKLFTTTFLTMHNKHLINKITLLIYFTIISFNWCLGQDNFKSENKFGWVNIGLGASSFGISLGINGSYQIKNNLISFRYIYNEDFCIIFCDSPPNKIQDLGLLYGLSAKKSKGFASISIGISYVSYNIRGAKISGGGGFLSGGTYEELNFYVVGIPIEIQLFSTGENVGIGIYGFANINPESSFFGALLSLQLGKLR